MATEKAHHIHELAPDQRILSAQYYRKYLHLVAQLAIWINYLYLTTRLILMVNAPSRTWPMWTMLMVEAIFIHLSLKEQKLSVAASRVSHVGTRKRLRLMGTQNLPRVDVLLPCCGEPIDVIMKTMQAACTLDYPISQFRVLVLDDGGSALLETTVARQRSRWPHLSYHSRGRQSGQVFAKSGNLNYALTSLQRKNAPEFCAVLDADSIPTTDFLRATLPHLLLNPEVALVSTRQYFSNLPEGDPLSQARCHFYTCQNAALDVLGHAIDAGSGAVFRRKSIVEVGLYPTFSFSEDWQLSLVLQGLGFKTVQIQEPLQFGLVPTSLTGHIVQRNRWNIGHAQQIVAMWSQTNSSLPVDLRRRIALNGMGIITGELGCFVGFVAVPLLMISGQLIPITSLPMMWLQILLSSITISLAWLYEYLQAVTTGFQSAPFAHMENKWLAGGNILSILRFYLFSSKPKGSFVTGSTANSWNRITSMPLCLKLHRDLWHNGVLYNVSILVGTFAAMAYATVRIMADDDGSIIPRLLTNAAWPPLIHICFLTVQCNWVPVSYMLHPPHYPGQQMQPLRADRGIFSSDTLNWDQAVSSRLKLHEVDRMSAEVLHLGGRIDMKDDIEL